MTRALVIGYGNLLRRDDGVGVRVAEALLEEGLRCGARILPAHQLTVELAEPLGRARWVLFVDARLGGRPGSIVLERVRPRTEAASLSHHLDPGALLQLSLALYGRVPEARALSVSGAEFSLGDELSPAVADAFPTLLDRARRWLRRRTLPEPPSSGHTTGAPDTR